MFLRVILCFIYLVAIVCGGEKTTIPNSCPLPSPLKTNYDFKWNLRPHEWINKDAITDYLALVLSWSPTFCASLSEAVRAKTFQCTQGANFGLIVHGLWPQKVGAKDIHDHARNCRDDGPVNATLIKRYFCLMPAEELIQEQWEKHGSCYYKTPAEYYATIEKLYRSLRIPDIRAMQNPSISAIKSAFTAANPGLFASAIYVTVENDNDLEEIKICFNLKYEFVRC